MISPILSKLQNQADAKKYSIDDFNKLADWKAGITYTGQKKPKKYITRTGNVICFDSENEKKIIEYLDRLDMVQCFGGQALRIPYSSYFAKNLSYYPDIVAFTNDSHIAIIEVKSITAMDYHKNVEKYFALRRFSEEHGYEYMMVDPKSDYMTIDELANRYCYPDLEEDFKDIAAHASVDPKHPFIHIDQKEIDQWYKIYGIGNDRTEIDLMVHSLVLRYNWYNTFQNGFSIYSRPVKFDKNNNIIGWA